MELINQTAVPARITAHDPPDPGAPRRAVVVAKATFALRPGPRLETQSPVPLFADDEPTDLGVLPGDGIPRFDDAFEVILLGAAHAPGGRPLRSMTVHLRVGEVVHRLLVHGDRHWTTRMGRRVASEPLPFVRMPLTWERAHGGSCDVWIDRDAVVPVQDPLNPAGRGFDPTPLAEGLARHLRAPAGYPVVRYERMLPNLEHPAALIAACSDAPEAYGWSTLPRTSGLAMLRLQRGLPGPGRPRLSPQAAAVLYRAHPDWTLPPVGPGAPVELRGCDPNGALRFALPRLQVLVDTERQDRPDTIELVPQQLVLLPEASRFYLVYRASFVPDGRGTTARLRLQEGWYRR